MNITPTQREILGLERKYWDAMAEKDVETAVSLTRFPGLVASPKGLTKVSEAEYRKMMNSNDADDFKGIELAGAQVETLADDAAVITYNVKLHGRDLFNSSTWIREHGKWICAFHSEMPKEKH